jgi:hypothetical protein
MVVVCLLDFMSQRENDYFGYPGMDKLVAQIPYELWKGPSNKSALNG